MPISSRPYMRSGLLVRSAFFPSFQLPRASPAMKAPRTVEMAWEVLPKIKPVSRTHITS